MSSSLMDNKLDEEGLEDSEVVRIMVLADQNLDERGRVKFEDGYKIWDTGSLENLFDRLISLRRMR